MGPGVFTIAFDRDDVALWASQANPPGATARADVDLRRESTRASYQEVTLSQMDGLLRQVIRADRVDDVRREIVAVLSNVFDHQDVPHAMVEERTLTGPDGTPLPNGSYLRVPTGHVSTYSDPATGTEIRVPGIILAALRNVMRTDGMFCDAILGQGEALDTYSQGLQDAAVDAKALANDQQRALTEKERLGQQLIRDGSTSLASVWSTIYPPVENDSLALVTTGQPANGKA